MQKNIQIMRICYKNNKIKLPVRKTEGLGRAFGLMLKSKNTDNLLFEFGKNVRIAITSWFVFFHFLVIWLDGKNNVLDFDFVKPFRFCVRPKKAFRKFVEIPVNFKNRKIIEFFVGRKV